MRQEKTLNKYFAIILIFFTFSKLQGFPLGFGKNQGDQEYNEIITDDFFIYHDKRAPDEAYNVLSSLEASKPLLESWLEVERSSPLPIIISSETANASFANFITDVIELQTLGKGGRDLVYHEYIHSMMYRHLENVFGPAGSIIHLPFMPSWWIEGIAEALSASHGSERMLAIEKYCALNNQFPTYERLHSLYGKSNFSSEGYAISGLLVSHILKEYGTEKLVPILKDFYSYSMPWTWPWAMVPFNDFLPMDASLKKHTGKNGRELYEEYKNTATEYWEKQSQIKGFEKSLVYSSWAFDPNMKIDGEKLKFTLGKSLQKHTYSHNLKIDKAIKIASDLNREHSYPKYRIKKIPYKSNSFINLDYIRSNNTYRLSLENPLSQSNQIIKTYSNKLYDLSITGNKVTYIHKNLDKTKFCYIDIEDISLEKCPLEGKGPVTYKPMNQFDSKDSDKALLLKSIETPTKTHFEWIFLDITSGNFSTKQITYGGEPLAIAPYKNSYYGIYKSYNGRILRKLDSKLNCTQQVNLPYSSNQLVTDHQNQIYLTAFSKSNVFVTAMDLSTQKFTDCMETVSHISPILYKLGIDPKASFSRSFNMASLKANLPQSKLNFKKNKSILVDPPITKKNHPKSIPATTKVRPIFGFPWIGADALGLSYGLISVPLMDYRQNHTVRASFLYGIESRYPNTEISYYLTRYKPTFKWDIFRYQTYNGSWSNADKNFVKESWYYDEIGGRFTVLDRLGKNFGISYGLQASYLKPYIGPDSFYFTERQGNKYQFFIGLNNSLKLGRLLISNHLNYISVPDKINENFEFQKYKAGTKVTIPFRVLSRYQKITLGLSGGATVGENSKTPQLRETYSPLKTYIPGGGGGDNQFHFGVAGNGNLTSAINGDRSFRSEAIYTVPIFPQLDTLFGIFYLDRLDFSAFYNYGNAWYEEISIPRGDNVEAVGYALDLQSDLKGITINVGLGTGKVIGKEFEVYSLFGFDALID